eukprot:6204042-Pleurochrysis_carterae.AAC.1
MLEGPTHGTTYASQSLNCTELSRQREGVRARPSCAWRGRSWPSQASRGARRGERVRECLREMQTWA